MSSKPVYSDQYFVNLMAMAMSYGKIYVTSDANHYRDEASAVGRCRDFMKIRQIVMYTEVTPASCPTNADELEKMFKLVQSAADKPVEVKEVPKSFDLEAARKALEERKGVKAEPKTKKEKAGKTE